MYCLPLYGELSNQVQHFFKIHFIRCPPLQTFARAVVQRQHSFFDVLIRILRNILMFRKIFAQQPVGVLVRPALLRLVRRRGVYFHPQRLRHHRVPREFLATVWRDAMHWLPCQHLENPGIHVVCRLLLQPHAVQITAFAVNQRQQHRAANHACHGVGFPIANARPCLRLWRTFRQLMRDREVVARGVALAPALLAAMTQPLLAAFHPVRVIETPGINAAVDGRVADGMRAAFMAQAVLDLLRRPVLFQKPVLDQGKKFRVIKFTLAAAELTPAVVFLLRLV